MTASISIEQRYPIVRYLLKDLTPVNPDDEIIAFEENGEGIVEWISFHTIGQTYEGGAKSQIKIYKDREKDASFILWPESIFYNVAAENANKVGIAIWNFREEFEALIWCNPRINYTSHIKIVYKNMDAVYVTELGGAMLLRFRG